MNTINELYRSRISCFLQIFVKVINIHDVSIIYNLIILNIVVCILTSDLKDLKCSAAGGPMCIFISILKNASHEKLQIRA